MNENYPCNIDYSYFIGQTVYKRSKKPFSNGEKEAIVTGITINPFSGRQAFTFEDSKIVDCFQCRLLK